MNIGQGQSQPRWKNGPVGNKIMVFLLLVFKLLSTICYFVSYSLRCLMAFSSFSILYGLALMYDEKVVAKYGVFILMMLGCISLVITLSPFLLLINNKITSAIGVICVLALNTMDIICCVLSFVQTAGFLKLINMLFSFLVVLISCRLLRKMWKDSDSVCKKHTPKHTP